MKIAFVCGFAWEPKGTVRARAHPLAVELTRRGHQVQIIVVPYDNPSYSGRTLDVNGVSVHNVSVDCSPPSRIAEVLRQLKQFQPDIVHIFKPKGYSGLVAMILFAQGHRNVVLDCDDWEGWGGWNDVAAHNYLLKEFIDVQERLLTRRMSAVTVASRALEERSVQLGQNNVYYVPNCLADLHIPLFDSLSRRRAEDLKTELGIPDCPLVLYAGHFNPADDIAFLCRSMKQVLAEANAIFGVVGDGPELKKVRVSFRDSERVRFFGKLVYQEFVRVVHACDITVFPYPANPVYRAKCSARIIDFMAAGRAVVTTEVGQNGEYIQNGTTGVLVAPDDETAFVSGILRLISDKSERERLGTNAALRIRECFLWSGSVIENCEAAYKKAANAV